MEKMLLAKPQSFPVHPRTRTNDDLVAKRIDELEELSRFSVIYELARIETMLRHLTLDEAPGEPIRTAWRPS